MSCLQKCKKYVSEQRCSRCLEIIIANEKSTICDACTSLLPYTSLYLYDPSPEALALYYCACLGNKSGIKNFAMAISRALILNEKAISLIVFSPNHLEKSFVVSIAKYLGVPYKKVSVFRKRKIPTSTERPCILSAYPLDANLREEIAYNLSEVLFMSLFPPID
ncbi:hypothetical protein [Chlamydia sp.]|uniref:hypothetical protein n=1 Tax=Chlamydia sp. TaxID=35827 RepID=UPI0025C2DC68|nr:hypothetical protein [Chlamydia sp.]